MTDTYTEPLEAALRDGSLGTGSVVDQWLHEAHSTFLGNAQRSYTDCSSMNVGACEQLYMAYELTTKAVIHPVLVVWLPETTVATLGVRPIRGLHNRRLRPLRPFKYRVSSRNRS